MKTYDYRDEAGFSKFLIVMIVLSLGLNVIGTIGSLMEFNMLVAVKNGMDLSDEAANANDNRQATIGITQVALSVFVAIIFCMWTYRMNRNAKSIENNTMDSTPGWAVGWYFIPIMNLWKPYQAMKETYETFINGASNTMVLPVWWFAWIVSNILGRIVFRMSMRAEELDQLINASAITVGSDAFDVFLDIMGILLVYTVSKACAERFTEDDFAEASLEWE